MRLPSFDEATRVASGAVFAGRPVPALAQDLLGLRFWLRMPVCLRVTRSGAPRRGMVRHYVSAIRARLLEAQAAAVIQGVNR